MIATTMNDVRARAGLPPTVFHEPVVVKCPACGQEKTIAARARNNERDPGQYCDGTFGQRHDSALMVGPRGRAKE